MSLFFRALFVVLVSQIFHVQFASANNDLQVEQYIEISENLPLLPIILISTNGTSVKITSNSEGYLTLERGRIVDEDDTNIDLPGNSRFQSFDDFAGLYLVEHLISGRLAFRYAKVLDEKVILGKLVMNPLGSGSAITLQGGKVGLLSRSERGGALTLDLARFQGGQIILNERPHQYPLPKGNLIRLGTVFHPTTRENGLVLLEQGTPKRVLIFFEASPPATIFLEEPVQAFAAGGDSLILGLIPMSCAKQVELPKGICTPFIFRTPIPKADLNINSSSLQKFSRLSNSLSGWTFGTDLKDSDELDVKVIDDRVYVIQSRGMTQSLGYYSLQNPIFGKQIITPMNGIKLSFDHVIGEPGSRSLVVKRRHLVEPTEVLLVNRDDTIRTIFEVARSALDKEADLAIKVYPAREEHLIPPTVMVAKRSLIEGNPCSGGTALIEIYGGYRVALEPRNPIGLLPELLAKNGVLVMASIPGSGGYGVPWAEFGAFENARNQTASVKALAQLLRQSGCQRIVLSGFSHGGVVALNALLTAPELIDTVVVGGAPLDLVAEMQLGNEAVAAFRPRSEAISEQSKTTRADIDALAALSPKVLAMQAQDLTGRSVFIYVGSEDRVAKTYVEPETIDTLRSKGAEVTVIERPGVGHTKFSNSAQWAEYHAIIGRAIASAK